MAPGRKRGGKAAAALAAAKQDWNIGDLVLAKVKGFPYWPAEISNPADWGRSTDPRKIFVYFFGTKQIGYCSVADLKPLNGEEKKKLLTKVQAKSATTDFCRAVNEILNADEKSRSENATTATTTMERFETELESKGKVSKYQDIDEQSEGKNKEPRHQQTLLEDAYETLAVHCYGVKADEKTLEGEAELEDKHVDRNAKHKLLVRTIAEAQDSKVEPEVVVLDLPKSATTSLGKANPRNTFARSVSDEQKDLAHAFAGANVRVKQDFKKKRGDSRKGSKSYTQVFKEAEDKHPSAGLETRVAGLPSEEGKLSMGKGWRFMKGNRGSFAKPELLQTARDSPAGRSDVMGFKHEGDGNEKNAARNWFSESSYDSENDGMNANLPTFYSKYKDAPVSGERHNDRNCSEALLRSSLPKKKRSATRKPERDNTESTAIQAMHTEVVSKILQNDGAQHDVSGMLSDDACGTKLKERPSRITTQQASPVEDICAPNEPECESEVDRRTDFSEGNKYMHPVKRRRAMDYYANKAVEGLSEVKEEQQCPSSIMEPITERGGKPMGDLDEHLPLVKRARARVDKDKDNLTPGLECDFNSPGKQKEEQTHVGMKEAESMKEAVSPYKIEEHSPKLEPNQKFENIPEVSESKLLSNKGTSLPPKADKYRLRSSLADGEATLPPSKRWQRAHEAMAACATEAVSAKLAEPVEKDQGPIANTNLNSKNRDNLALARNELEEKTNACDESPNDAHLTGEIAGKFVTLGARLDKINGSAWEDDNSKDVVGRLDGLSEVKLMMPQKSSTQFEKATGQDAEKVKARGKLGKKTGLEPDSHKMPNKIISNSPKKPVNVELTSSSSMGRNFESGNAIEARFDKLELQNNDKKKKMKKLVSNSGKELPSVVFGPTKHGGSERPSNVEKLSHETHHKNLEASAKCVVSVPVDSKGMKSGKETMNAKAVSEEVITVNGGNTSMSAGLYGSSKLQGEATANRVREAVAAAKVVKQRTLLKDGEVSTSSTTMKYLIAAAQARKQARTASASSFFSTVEVDKLPVALFSSPSPGNSPLADSPTQVTPRDANRFSSVRMKSPDAALDTVQNSGHRFGDECYTMEDDSLLLSNDTEAFVARDTFEGMLETLSRTKDSIARATRHALECVKYGIAGQVVELITRKLETEPSLHRRVDLFFLVDSITQCSHQSKGDSAVAYPPAVQMLLPRIVNATVPPGNTARENRRQCLRVLKIWLERSIMPESMLKGFINQLESKDGKSSGGLLRRSQRALDDPLREMEGMLVDEYGSNTGFSIPGLSLPRMYEDNEENSGFVKSTKDTADLVEESKEASDELQPSIEKHRHILEAVDGELEMEDVFPTTEEARRVNIICDGEERGEYGVTKAKEFPPLPLDPPPPESPPPPLPCSPPPPPPSLPSSPPPPPPSSPPPLPSPSNHCSSSIGLHRSEQVGREGVGYCFPAATLVQDERNFEQFSQPPFNLPPLIQESSLNKNKIMGPDSAFSLSSGFMIGRTPLSQSYAIRPASSSSIPMQNASQIQSLPVAAVLSQAHYRHLTSPSPPPPPPPPPHPSFTYNADISCQTSSSPLVNLERPSPQISKAHGEQWIGLSSDSARRLFDDGGHFSPSDGQLPSGNSEFRLVQGGHYVCRSPCVQQQGPPQTVSEAPYANHRQQMPMVPYRGDVTSNVWRPS